MDHESGIDHLSEACTVRFENVTAMCDKTQKQSNKTDPLFWEQHARSNRLSRGRDLGGRERRGREREKTVAKI